MDEELKRFLDDAAGRASGDEVKVTIRDLLGRWGARRRGYLVVDEINRDLLAAGIVTSPSFEVGWIDSTVRLVPIASTAASRQTTGRLSEPEDSSGADLGGFLSVRSLPSASRAVVSVQRTENLLKAQSLMFKNDFSQLAVLAGKRELVGAISWESIARARLNKVDCDLEACLVASVPVSPDDDLLSRIPDIVEKSFVFVQAKDKTLCGIVTPADLSLAFVQLAGPFLVVGEIERNLREIARVFPLDQLQAVRNSEDAHRAILGPEDLTIGEFKRLFEDPARWGALSWPVDRIVFISALDEFRTVRNEIMHFSPDPIEEDRLRQMQSLLKWVRYLNRSGLRQ